MLYNEPFRLSSSTTIVPTGGTGMSLGIGIAAPTSKLHVVSSLGSLAAQGDATYINIATTAQADTNIRVGMRVDLTAGYVAAGSSIALSFLNSVAGTANNMIDITGNAGIRGNTNPTTTGYNYGTVGLARDGNLNIGMYGRSFVAKNSATNIGAFGIARNTGSSPVEIGGFFGLYASGAAAPTLISGALVCSNGVSTSDIFVARDANTTVFTIADGGVVTLTAPVTLKGYTVATLPAGVVGYKAYVTDALAPAYLVAVVGGGAIVTEVFYNGAAWVCT